MSSTSSSVAAAASPKLVFKAQFGNEFRRIVLGTVASPPAFETLRSNLYVYFGNNATACSISALSPFDNKSLAAVTDSAALGAAVNAAALASKLNASTAAEMNSSVIGSAQTPQVVVRLVLEKPDTNVKPTAVATVAPVQKSARTVPYTIAPSATAAVATVAATATTSVASSSASSASPVASVGQREVARLTDAESRLKAELKDSLKNEVLAELRSLSLKETAPSAPAPKPQSTTPARTMVSVMQVVCDHCSSVIQPSADRFKCTTCPDFDLCGSCNQTANHPHTLNAMKCVTEAVRTAIPKYPAPIAPELKYSCDKCSAVINGERWHCKTCVDYDLCQTCGLSGGHGHSHSAFLIFGTSSRPSSASSKPAAISAVHQAWCDSCSVQISGARHKCASCEDYDLCSVCVKRRDDVHTKFHRFVTIPTASEADTAKAERSVIGQVHSNVLCDVCDHEIVGVRYKCFECPDFDMCAECEGKLKHPESHILAKIRVPIPAEVELEAYTVREPAPAMPDVTSAVANIEPVVPVQPAEPIVHQAVFVEDLSIPDNTVMQPGQTFTKTWKVVNPGPATWPEGVKLVFVGGKNMSATESAVATPAVGAYSQSAVSIDMVAPVIPGMYTSTWRLALPNGERFGHSLWCQINVAAPQLPVTPVKTAAAPETPRTMKVDEGSIAAPLSASPSRKMSAASSTRASSTFSFDDDDDDFAIIDEAGFYNHA